MPYKSAKQRAYLHIHEPEVAAKFDAEIRRRKKRGVPAGVGGPVGNGVKKPHR